MYYAGSVKLRLLVFSNFGVPVSVAKVVEGLVNSEEDRRRDQHGIESELGIILEGWLTVSVSVRCRSSSFISFAFSSICGEGGFQSLETCSRPSNTAAMLGRLSGLIPQLSEGGGCQDASAGGMGSKQNGLLADLVGSRRRVSTPGLVTQTLTGYDYTGEYYQHSVPPVSVLYSTDANADIWGVKETGITSFTSVANMSPISRSQEQNNTCYLWPWSGAQSLTIQLVPYIGPALSPRRIVVVRARSLASPGSPGTRNHRGHTEGCQPVPLVGGYCWV